MKKISLDGRHHTRDLAIGWLADSLALRAGSLIDPLKYQRSGGMYTEVVMFMEALTSQCA